MYIDYINEAFKNLDLLTEDMFDTSPSGIDNLSRFMDEDDDVEEVRVIDADASDEDDIQDSYIGKVIINCNVCHSHVFEDKDEIVLADDGFANMEMQCPYCGETEGFTIVGEIAEFSASEKDPVDAENTLENDDDVTPVTEAPSDVVVESVEAPVHHKYKPHTIRLLKLIGSDLVDDADLEEDLTGGLIGAGSGAAIGAGIGSAIAPGIGTAIGAGLGTLAGGVAGDMLTEDSEETKEDSELTEDFKEVSITTDDQHMEMTSDDSGKVSIVTEPVQADTDGDMIVPLSAETESDIIENNEETSIEDIPATEDTPDDSFEDIDFEDIDETTIDELGESYLKRVYENVESFKTSNVFSTETGIIIEGVIGFTSGAKKKTKFMFESADMNDNGQVRFIGSNKHLTESCNAYSLVGRISDKKLFVESLKYNYKTSDSNSVRGVVRKK